jgi:hypothetical protein
MNPNIARRRHARSAQHHHRNGHGHAKHPINVGDMERQLSMIGGATLAVCGLMRGSLSGLTLAVIGGALIWRGHTGHCEVYHLLGHSSADQSERGGESGDNEQHGGQEPSHAAGEAV